MNNIPDMDPLSSYEAFHNTTSYPYVVPNATYNYIPPMYNYNVKHDAITNPHLPINPIYNSQPLPCSNFAVKQTQIVENVVNKQQENIGNEVSGKSNFVNKEKQEEKKTEEEEEIDTKEHIQLLPLKKKRTKGKTSSYWNKKVKDANFPFYGCTICNISYQTLSELDKHVTIHEGRITSYDLRLRSRLKRKQKKGLKKIKKNKKKVKNERKTESVLDVDIKPEDGYIGSEKASEFNSNSVIRELESCNDNVQNESKSVQNESKNVQNESKNVQNVQVKSKSGEIDSQSTKNGKEEDPRLQKLFKCFACQKMFALSYYLKLHVRSHTDERPYACTECDQSFITSSKLARHHRRIHLSIRFQCRICYRFFTRFEYLTKHFDKKHEDQKIEGEPYDYNAILPYLKELEEELREKKERENHKEETFKTEEGYSEVPQLNDSKEGIFELLSSPIKRDPSEPSDPTDPTDPTLQTEDGVKVKLEDMKVKKEASDDSLSEDGPEPVFSFVDQGSPPDLGGRDSPRDGGRNSPRDFGGRESPRDLGDRNRLQDLGGRDSLRDIGGKDNPQGFGDHGPRDDDSDEDYFPLNTWVTTPKMEPPDPKYKPKYGHKYDANEVTCEICNKKLTYSYLRVHMRIHTGEKPFKCSICDSAFITASKLNRHLLTHSDDETDTKVKKEDGDIKTEENEGDKSAKKRKRGRRKKTDAPRKKLKLPKFPESRPKSEGKRPKNKEVKNKRELSCPYCTTRFLHEETLKVHIERHKGEKLILRCNFCLEEMANEEALKEHEATHIGPRPYVCTLCNRNYTKKETMVYHRKSHTEVREFICDICSKTFNAQCKLQRHIVTHKMERFIYKYECPVCAHMFNTKYHIQMHLSTHQKEGLILEENRSEILAMVLQNARKIPKKPDDAVALLDSSLMPADERSRVCNICGEVFQHFYYLEEHLKSHGSKIAIEDNEKDEEKKHICPVCNKGFKLHYYLKLHSYTHTKEKPFTCQQCGKGFITKGKLKRHLETHAGLKKYQCHICYKFFTRTAYLRIHVRTIHGTQDYNFKQYTPNVF